MLQSISDLGPERSEGAPTRRRGGTLWGALETGQDPRGGAETSFVSLGSLPPGWKTPRLSWAASALWGRPLSLVGRPPVSFGRPLVLFGQPPPFLGDPSSFWGSLRPFWTELPLLSAALSY